MDMQGYHSHVGEIIERDFYVNDLITGAQNADEAIKVAETISKELRDYCFVLRKWCSNDKTVLESLGSEEPGNVGYFISDEDRHKTLGIFWNANDDVLENIIDADDTDERVTKRHLLSVISKLFDPLGMLGPIVIQAKLILQKLWELKLSWDESLPLQLFTSWNTFY